MAPGRRSKETTLRQNLYTLRQAISQYTQDKKKAPQTLNDLVTGGYMKSIPNDPFTNQPNWILEREDGSAAAGIADIHSASTLRATDGSAYSSW